MKVEKISVKNAAYQKFEVLKTNRNKRHKYGQFFVEGVRNLNGCIAYGWEIASFLFSGDKPLSRWATELLETTLTQVNYQLSSSLMEELSGKEEPSELMAVVNMRPDSFSQLHLSETPLLALFDRPSNRGNLGTILRSCDSLGVEGLLLTGHGVDLYDPEVVVSSMGSFFRVPTLRIASPGEVEDFVGTLRSRYPGFQTVGTTAHQELPLDQVNFTLPTLLLIGNETDGLSHAYRESCDLLTTIPMDPQSYASSFNVGCAATVLFYEAQRQRRHLLL